MWRLRHRKKIIKLPTIIEETQTDVIEEEQQELKRVVCDVCNKSYSKYYIKRHMKHLHGIKT